MEADDGMVVGTDDDDPPPHAVISEAIAKTKPLIFKYLNPFSISLSSDRFDVLPFQFPLQRKSSELPLSMPGKRPVPRYAPSA